MNQKRIGIFLILISLFLAGLFYKIKLDSDQHIQLLMELQAQEGTASCFLEDGTCLHQQENRTFLFGEGGALILFTLGLYLIFFDKSQKLFALQAEQNVKVATALKQAEEEKKKEVGFTAFLAGFSENEQKIFKAIHDQEGILQSTLKYRTGLTKTDVSLILKKFEEKGYITKKQEGNTNKIFLRKIF